MPPCGLADPYLVQRYGSLSSSPVRLMTKTYFGLKETADEQVSGAGRASHLAVRASPIADCVGALV